MKRKHDWMKNMWGHNSEEHSKKEMVLGALASAGLLGSHGSMGGVRVEMDDLELTVEGIHSEGGGSKPPKGSPMAQNTAETFGMKHSIDRVKMNVKGLKVGLGGMSRGKKPRKWSGSWDSEDWDSKKYESWDSEDWDSKGSGSWDTEDWDSKGSGSWDSEDWDSKGSGLNEMPEKLPDDPDAA